MSLVIAVMIFTPMRADSEPVSIWQIVNQLSFYDVGVSSGYIPRFFFDLFPYILFQLLWGTYLYERFCTASVYFFTRQDNKSKWYWGECVKLYLWGIVYLASIVFVGTIWVAVGRKITWDPASLYVLVIYLLLYSLFLFATSMLINLLSVRIKSAYGFGVVVGIELLMIVVYGVMGEFFPPSEEEGEELKNCLTALKCNPLSHLVFKWHGSIVGKVDQMINQYQLSFLIEKSVLVWGIAAVVAALAGLVIINRTELIENRKE